MTQPPLPRLAPLVAALALPFALLALWLLPLAGPARAVEACAPGLAVITPDGDSAAISGGSDAACQVQLPSGVPAGPWPAEMLMPDFGLPVEEVTAGLPPGHYQCESLSLDLLEDGFYTDAAGNEGGWSIEGAALIFTDGPLAGRVARAADGVLIFEGQPCQLTAD